jgi:hypothetical protein
MEKSERVAVPDVMAPESVTDTTLGDELSTTPDTISSLTVLVAVTAGSVGMAPPALARFCAVAVLLVYATVTACPAATAVPRVRVRVPGFVA